jgi:hypothetical protein
VAVIGRGSSGVVKKVLHKPSGGIYVLKVINFDMGCEQVRLQPQQCSAASGTCMLAPAVQVQYTHAYVVDCGMRCSILWDGSCCCLPLEQLLLWCLSRLTAAAARCGAR